MELNRVEQNSRVKSARTAGLAKLPLAICWIAAALSIQDAYLGRHPVSTTIQAQHNQQGQGTYVILQSEQSLHHYITEVMH